MRLTGRQTHQSLVIQSSTWSDSLKVRPPREQVVGRWRPFSAHVARHRHDRHCARPDPTVSLLISIRHMHNSGPLLLSNSRSTSGIARQSAACPSVSRLPGAAAARSSRLDPPPPPPVLDSCNGYPLPSSLSFAIDLLAPVLARATATRSETDDVSAGTNSNTSRPSLET